MGALKLDQTPEVDAENDSSKNEKEIVSLLATLVRAHYLEKSQKYQNAMDFERLFKLDSLDQLKHLEELENLRALDQLKNMDKLQELSKLSDLNNLSKLKSLTHLEALDNLTLLGKLDQLNNLHNLDRISELDKLDKLKELRELDKLKVIEKLGVLLHENKGTLEPLVYLEKLLELSRLDELHKLEKLSALDKLEQLGDLDKLNKLDRIDDARFAERLNKLDKLDILKEGTKKLVIQQCIGFGLDLFKLTVAGLLIVFMLTRETSREVIVKALPAIGFGSGAQVNLGLQLLVGETSPDQFQTYVSEVRKRIDAEISNVVSTSSMLPLSRRLEIVSQLQTYNFKTADVDLEAETTKKLQAKLSELHKAAADRLDYNMSLAKGRGDSERENRLREMKLLLIQKQYPQLLEKVLPHWGTDEAITMAAIAGSLHLKLEDPRTLEQIIEKEMPGRGEI